MEVRNSPYNTPFIPYFEKGVYWLGLEYQKAPHDSHVSSFKNSSTFEAAKYLRLRSAHIQALAIANLHRSLTDSEYEQLRDLYFNFGIQAAGKRLGIL